MWVPLHRLMCCSARPVKTLFLYTFKDMTSPKWHVRHFWSFVFLPLQWNYLRWLRRRRHFIWWWSTPVAVSERAFPRARCGFTHAVNKSRISPISQMLELVSELNKRWEWMEWAWLLLMYDRVPLSPVSLGPPISAVMPAFCSKGSPKNLY